MFNLNIMKIRIGKTRIVFLVKNLAIKIAKPRALRFIFRIIFLPFASKKNQADYYASYGKNFGSAFKKYVFLGFYSNLYEYNYYKKYKDKDVSPVYRIYFWGWIILQKKGEDIAHQDFICPFLKFGFKLSPETIGLQQYCYDKDIKRNLLVDYGHIDTIKDLLRTKHLR